MIVIFIFYRNVFETHFNIMNAETGFKNMNKENWEKSRNDERKKMKCKELKINGFKD